MLAALTSQTLKGVLLNRNTVRIHAEPDVLEKLRTCGLGTRGSKRRVKARKEQEAAAVEAPAFIEITLEEAYFLQSSLKCLQVGSACGDRRLGMPPASNTKSAYVPNCPPSN